MCRPIEDEGGADIDIDVALFQSDFVSFIGVYHFAGGCLVYGGFFSHPKGSSEDRAAMELML